MAVWLVRAGKKGERENYALENDCVVVGWSECPSLTHVQDREELYRILETTYPDGSKNTLKNWESQLWAVVKSIQKGDIVALPLKSRSVVAFGKVVGDYQYVADAPEGTNHRRPVEWLREVPRSEIGQDLLYSLGAFLTVCRIVRNDAEARVDALITSGKDGYVPPIPHVGDDGGTDEERLSVDLESSIRDQIRAVILSRFKGNDLANLVGAVLEAQGLQTVVSGAGPDGGVDIIAGTGHLGFGRPRFVVQVKSEQTAVDVKVVRELQGVMAQFGAERGLFVAWGGFKPTVYKEFAKDYFRIRLWTGEDLIDQVFEHYRSLPPDIQAELPLKQVWMLALPES